MAILAFSTLSFFLFFSIYVNISIHELASNFIPPSENDIAFFISFISMVVLFVFEILQSIKFQRWKGKL